MEKKWYRFDTGYWTASRVFIACCYFMLIDMIGGSIYNFRYDIFASVGSVMKYFAIYFVVIYSIVTIIKAFRRDRGNFGHEHDEPE
jgi:hypothetical protein